MPGRLVMLNTGNRQLNSFGITELPVEAVRGVRAQRGNKDMPDQIITDAEADMDRSRWDVCVIPMEVRLNENTYLYGPNGTIRIHDFYKAQQAGAQTGTSQIFPHEFNRGFEPYFPRGKEIL